MISKGVKTIFFDYDGTIHNSLVIYAPAFRKAYDKLVERGLAKERTWSELDISKWIGYNPNEMWERFMPNLELEIRNKSSGIIGQEMNRLIALGVPKLYDNAVEVLKYLKDKGYTLVLLSNCKRKYIENHKKLFNLDVYFSGIYCSEDFGYKKKTVILKEILKMYPKDMIFVGDRSKDIEAGRVNDMRTIGCTYGFGTNKELELADIKIGNIEELIKIF